MTEHEENHVKMFSVRECRDAQDQLSLTRAKLETRTFALFWPCSDLMIRSDKTLTAYFSFYFQVALRLVCEDRQPKPMEAAGADVFRRARAHPQGHREGRRARKGRNAQGRVSLITTYSIFLRRMNTAQLFPCVTSDRER